MRNVIVVGTGISGLMASITLARLGTKVTMLSHLEAMRSASCMAQGGINAAEQREGDTPMLHFTDTIKGGAWLSDQPPVMEMCSFAPSIISMYDRLGVAFNRHEDGSPDTRFFGGTKIPRTHYADTTTGYQLLLALDSQSRRYEDKNLITRVSGCDFVCALIKDGQCFGCVVQDIYTMKLQAYTGDALVIATGGYAGLYGWATTSALSNGAVIGQLMLQGLPVANPEFVQFHPTSMAGSDKPRLISESARGEGGRLWVPKHGKPWYFLEEMYPEYGNLITRDLASRAIYKVVMDMGLGIDGKRQVYLDITHLEKSINSYKLSNIIEMYRKYTGENPELSPMRVFPSPHYSMGGLYVDSKHRTEVEGLYACGECDFLYHGGNRLGGNSLLSATYGGYVVAQELYNAYENGALLLNKYFPEEKWIAQILSGWELEINSYFAHKGNETASSIETELGEILTVSAGIVRCNTHLKEACKKVHSLRKRWHNVAVPDKSKWANSSLVKVRKLKGCLALAEAIIAGALERNESRGSHYKPEYPQTDNSNWLKSTIARYEQGKIKLQYKPVDISITPPESS